MKKAKKILLVVARHIDERDFNTRLQFKTHWDEIEKEIEKFLTCDCEKKGERDG